MAPVFWDLLFAFVLSGVLIVILIHKSEDLLFSHLATRAPGPSIKTEEEKKSPHQILSSDMNPYPKPNALSSRFMTP